MKSVGKSWQITNSKRSLNNGHLSHKALFYGLCGSFILLRDVNVMLRMMCHYFSYLKWALFLWCAASCKSAIENSCKLEVQFNMVADIKRAASVWDGFTDSILTKLVQAVCQLLIFIWIKMWVGVQGSLYWFVSEAICNCLQRKKNQRSRKKQRRIPQSIL